jgi:hypothetical protein
MELPIALYNLIREHKEHREFKVLAELMDHKEHREFKVLAELMDHKAHRVFKVLLVQTVLRVHKVFRELLAQDRKALLAHRGPKELREFKAVPQQIQQLQPYYTADFKEN